MNPEEYHKALEELVVRWPVAMSTLIQVGGPLPDGETDGHRALIYRIVKDTLEGMSIG